MLVYRAPRLTSSACSDQILSAQKLTLLNIFKIWLQKLSKIRSQNIFRGWKIFLLHKNKRSWPLKKIPQIGPNLGTFFVR